MQKRSFIVLLSVLIVSLSKGKEPQKNIERIQEISAALKSNPDSIRVASLQVIDGTHQNHKKYIEANYVLGLGAIKKHQFTDAENYLNTGLKVAQNQKDSFFIALFFYRLGSIYYSNGDFDKAKVYFSKTYDIAKLAQDDYNKINALNGLGIVANRKGDQKKGEQYFREGVPLAIRNNFDQQLWILHYSLMDNLSADQRYSEALIEGQKALQIAEKRNDSSTIARSNLGIGLLCGQIENYTRSIRHLNRSKNYFLATGKDYYYALTLYNLSIVYRKSNQLDSAIIYGKKAEQLYDKVKIVPQQISAYNNLSLIHIEKQQYDTALAYAQKAIQFSEINNSSGFMAVTYQNMAKISLVKKEYRSAIAYCKKGISLYPKNHSISDKFTFYDILSQSYESLGNHKESLKYSRLKFEALNSKRDITEAKRITTIEANHQFEKEKSETEQAQLRKDFENAQKLNQRENLLIVGACILLLVCIIFFLLFRLYQNKRKDNVLLEKTNEEIKDHARKLSELDQLKSRFFTNISHEFRTPLTLIKGPVKRLSTKYKDQEDTKLFRTVERNTEKLLDLINQILELAELQSKARKLKLSSVDPVYFIRRTVGAFESMAEMKNIELTTSTYCKKNILFEVESIEKTLNNLLSNAFKFTSNEGSIHVSIDVKNDWMQLSVTNTGIGIEKEELENIFEMFYYTEADQSASSGIGLALVNELIKNHHGKIEVTSEKNAKTTFIISIPVSEDYYKLHQVGYEKIDIPLSHLENVDLLISEGVNGTPLTAKSTSNEDKKRLLVVEDNVDIRSFIKSILKDEFEIIEAQNGKQGLEKANHLIPDLILSDVMMPELDGFEMLKRIKEDEKTSHIPVVLLTAKGDRKSKLEGLSIQADEYLTKPFDEEELTIRINNLIKNRKLLQEKFSNEFYQQSEINELPSIEQQFFKRLSIVIEKNIEDPNFTIDQLAKEAGISRSQMHRKVVAITGNSTSTFIRNIRLKKAYQLLKGRKGNVSEIADQVGFSSASYFNRCFKEFYGVTPKQAMNDKNSPSQ